MVHHPLGCGRAPGLALRCPHLSRRLHRLAQLNPDLVVGRTPLGQFIIIVISSIKNVLLEDVVCLQKAQVGELTDEQTKRRRIEFE